MVKGKVMLVGVGLAVVCVLIAGVASEARLTTIIWRGIIAAVLAGGVAYLAGALFDAKTEAVMAVAEETVSGSGKNEKNSDKSANGKQESVKDTKKADESKEKQAEDKTNETNKKDGDDFKPMDGEGLTHLTAS